MEAYSALTVMTMGFGDIPITTEEPSRKVALAPSHLRLFEHRSDVLPRPSRTPSTAAVTMRVVGESISNVRASGICFDAGIRYISAIG